MEAGRRRHWLIFETLVSEQDSDGNVNPEWMPAWDHNTMMPCEVIALSGRELIAAQAVNSSVSVRIRCAYRPGFDAVQRARNPASGVVYNIEAVIPDPDSGVHTVTLQCSTGLNAGGTAA